MNIELTILAQDIQETEYLDKDDAITRALARAGRPDLRCAGTDIVISSDEDDEVVVISGAEFEKFNNKVQSMYFVKRGYEEGTIEDFTVTLQFN